MSVALSEAMTYPGATSGDWTDEPWQRVTISVLHGTTTLDQARRAIAALITNGVPAQVSIGPGAVGS